MRVTRFALEPVDLSSQLVSEFQLVKSGPETRLWYFTSLMWTRFKTDVVPRVRPWSFRRALGGRTAV